LNNSYSPLTMPETLRIRPWKCRGRRGRRRGRRRKGEVQGRHMRTACRHPLWPPPITTDANGPITQLSVYPIVAPLLSSAVTNAPTPPMSSNTRGLKPYPCRLCHPTHVSPFGFLGTIWIAIWIILMRDAKLKVRGLVSDNRSINDAEP